MSVTVCHGMSRVTSRELSRISHAMSTTPHHTSGFGSCLFVSRALRILNLRSDQPQPTRTSRPCHAAMRKSTTGGGR